MLARQTTRLEGRLAEARALRDTAKYDAGLKIAQAVVAEADHAPLQARAWIVLGQLHVHRGEYDAAADTLGQAYDLALALRMIDEAASASALLMH
ncbi:MAG: hypothetical protein AAGA69_02235, partial [Pseudomonadota bacterium]